MTAERTRCTWTWNTQQTVTMREAFPDNQRELRYQPSPQTVGCNSVSEASSSTIKEHHKPTQCRPEFNPKQSSSLFSLAECQIRWSNCNPETKSKATKQAGMVCRQCHYWQSLDIEVQREMCVDQTATAFWGKRLNKTEWIKGAYVQNSATWGENKLN